MRKLNRLIILVLLALMFQYTFASQSVAGFFKAYGKEIVDRNGNPIILRGIGLGGWLVPEGYMLKINGFFGSPTRIHDEIEDLIGEQYTNEFYEIYEANYVAEKDIQQIAQWGFNSVRLPFHYKLFYDPDLGSFKEDGFELLNTFLDWCKANELFIILDMHAAPGGQNLKEHSDSDGVVARLWTETANQDLTVKIWKEIAQRYADESWIIGFDLLNEPVLPSEFDNNKLRSFYERLASEIREVDSNHILFIEGSNYATDFTSLTPPFDNNMVYSFHKYWNKTDINTIQGLLDIREQYDIPLWLGETGENSNPWIYETIHLMEENSIGWNFWTSKKVETVTSPLSAQFSEGYQEILDYWNGKVAKPSADKAKKALLGLAENLSFEKCDYRPGVIPALFDPEFGSENKPFKALTIPGTINAVDYDLGTNGIAYSDEEYKNETGDPSQVQNQTNKGGKYRNDGVDIEESNDTYGFKYNVGYIVTGEWLKYTVNILTENHYDIEMRLASPSNQGRLSLLLYGQPLADNLSIPNTGEWQNWSSVNVHDVHFPAGIHELTLFATEGDFNINQLKFKELHNLMVAKAGDGEGIVWTSTTGIDCGVDCSENFEENIIVTLNARPYNGSFFAGWSGDNCSGTNETCDVTIDAAKKVTATFNYQSKKKLKKAKKVIQAENCFICNGVESTSANIRYINSGHWVMYDNIDFGNGQWKTFITKIAVWDSESDDSQIFSGKDIEIRLDSRTGTLIGKLTVAGTGGWDKYRTQATLLNQNVTGIHNVYLLFEQGEAPRSDGVGNMDWIQFTKKPKYKAQNKFKAKTCDGFYRIRDEGTHLGYIDAGDWLKCGVVDFGKRVNSFDVRIAVPKDFAYKDIDIVIDSKDGTPIGQLTVEPTGNPGEWYKFKEQKSCLDQPITGIHDVYLVLKQGDSSKSDGVGNIKWFKFKNSSKCQ